MNARPGPRGQNILRGVMLICRGDAKGFTLIGSLPDSFLTSLAPLIAFPLVGCGLMAAQGLVREGVTDFLASMIAILAPPVIAFSIARAWGKDGGWLRFATAFNWCQWALPLLGVLLAMIATVLVPLGLPLRPLVLALCVLLLGYAFWLHWFMARHALALRPLRAFVLVLIMNVTTLLLVGGPQILSMAIAGKLGAGA